MDTNIFSFFFFFFFSCSHIKIVKRIITFSGSKIIVGDSEGDAVAQWLARWVRFTDYLSGHLDKMLGVILRWTNILSRGAAMLLISPCHEIWDTFQFGPSVQLYLYSIVIDFNLSIWLGLVTLFSIGSLIDLLTYQWVSMYEFATDQ